MLARTASAVVGPDGYPVVAADPGGGEQVVLATCRLEEARRKDLNPHNHVFDDRRVDLYATDAAVVTARRGGAAAG